MALAYATWGWIAVATTVVVVEVCAPEGQLLSEQMDSWRAHPVGKYFATAGILLTASHLLRKLPSEVDPFTLAFGWKQNRSCKQT